MPPRKSRERIRDRLLRSIASGDKDPAGTVAREFEISRQAVNGHLRRMVSSGSLLASGSTRSRKYSLVETEVQRTDPLSPTLREDEVWREFVAPQLRTLPENVFAICQYGFTEMLNNAIDHSGGSRVTSVVLETALEVELQVIDNGIGVFRKIRETFGLADERHAVLELSKGKLTTDPERHSGEGIFFSSRLFDTFAILAGGLYFCHTPRDRDWLLEDTEAVKGSMISMRIEKHSSRTTKEVFDRFSSHDDEYKFAVTHVPVSLARIGDDNLISRSQAKRLLARFEKFSDVVLDFAGVETIGQAFADEIFRVFQSQHPTVKLRWVDANRNVEQMIQRARNVSDLG